MKDKLNIAFLFGAGVESKNNFNIKTGFDYLRKSIIVDINNLQHIDALRNRLKNKIYFKKTYKYTKDIADISLVLIKNFIIKRSRDSTDFKYTYIKELFLFLNKDERKELDISEDANSKDDNSKDDNSESKKYKEKTFNEFKEIINGHITKLSKINNKFLKDLFDNHSDDIIIDMNIGIAGLLDSYFHTIIDPDKYGPKNFSKIFNYYWACYFAILNDILVYFKDDDNLNCYLTNNQTIDYSKILNNINIITKYLYSDNLDLKLGTSYYQCIIDKLKDHKDFNCCGVATTNYFRFCSKIKPENTIYLNGQLKLFEFPELLEVHDLSKDSLDIELNDKLFFPFIFGQSLVKPIVNAAQTEEYSKLYKMLFSDKKDEAADVLIIMGYNINEDDNHINTFLHDFIKKGKRIIVLTDSEDCNADEKLKLNNNSIELCVVDYNKQSNEDIVNKIFSKIPLN